MDKGGLVFGVIVVALLCLGGFLGWHMTAAALAVVTLGVLILWLSIAFKALDSGNGPPEGLVAAGAGVLAVLAGVWAGVFARPLSAFLNGKTLRFATDLFIR